MSIFAAVPKAPDDPILGLVSAFKADKDPKKVTKLSLQLGLGGLYRYNGKEMETTITGFSLYGGYEDYIRIMEKKLETTMMGLFYLWLARNEGTDSYGLVVSINPIIVFMFFSIPSFPANQW